MLKTVETSHSSIVAVPQKGAISYKDNLDQFKQSDWLLIFFNYSECLRHAKLKSWHWLYRKVPSLHAWLSRDHFINLLEKNDSNLDAVESSKVDVAAASGSPRTKRPTSCPKSRPIIRRIWSKYFLSNLPCCPHLTMRGSWQKKDHATLIPGKSVDCQGRETYLKWHNILFFRSITKTKRRWYFGRNAIRDKQLLML